MSDTQKITSSHLRRTAYIYLRQSSQNQVENNRESTQRQYALTTKAAQLGWPGGKIAVIDEDLGLSAAGMAERSGFVRLTTETALGKVGIILGLEVSRMARNNAEWYRLLDLCGLTDTLIGDADGLYHPARFNDRMLLGLKGTMSEAELHILRNRLVEGARNKAARGELRLSLPIGFVWGEADGEVRFDPDEAICAVVRHVFACFAELGSARRVWLQFRSEGLKFPLRNHNSAPVRWGDPSYLAIYHVLTNPVYAGAYAYGKSRNEITVDEAGKRRIRTRKLPQNEWRVFIREHHQGFINWDTYERNRARLAGNTRPTPHQPKNGPVREGSALLQGIAICGHCGRKLRTHYTGRTASPGYHCPGKRIVEGRGCYCLSIGAMQIDEAVSRALLEALAPLGTEAALAAAERLETSRDTILEQWRLTVERAAYEAQRAERRYRAVDAENRLVARGLETEWEKRLRELEEAKAELVRREQSQPKALSASDRQRLLALGADLPKVWQAPTTTARDKKELLRALLEEVTVAVQRQDYRAQLTLRWRGGALTDIALDLPRQRQAAMRTDEDTIDLLRRLAAHYPDAVIAGILNRQGRHTAFGHPFTANRVSNLRHHWNIPCYKPPAEKPAAEILSLPAAAEKLGVTSSTVQRWINDGFIQGEQLTPGAPWRVRLTDELLSRVAEEAPEGYLTMYQTMRKLGVSRQTVLQRVKRGEINAVHIRRGRQKGLRLKVIKNQSDLFEQI